MSLKCVDACVDKGVIAVRIMQEICTYWSGPGGGHSMIDARGKEAVVVCKHDLPQKLIQIGRDVWSLVQWVRGFNCFFSVVKRKRKNSRCGARKARHTDPVKTSFLRANLPAMKTLVLSSKYLFKMISHC